MTYLFAIAMMVIGSCQQAYALYGKLTDEARTSYKIDALLSLVMAGLFLLIHLHVHH
jgi:hypothetical protein